MARVTIEDCIRYYPNRFEMVVLATRRARQLLVGMPPALKSDESENHKPAVQSLKEVGDGRVTWESVFEADRIERERRLAAQAAEAAQQLLEEDEI
jgi:DNA-directed RNA polymerase subunit omega